MDKAADALRVVMDAVALRFRSGNSIPIERAHITANEWAAIAEALEDARRVATKCAEAVPTNWCDPLLTGPDAALYGNPGTWSCHDIEALLSGVRKRIAAIAATEAAHD